MSYFPLRGQVMDQAKNAVASGPLGQNDPCQSGVCVCRGTLRNVPLHHCPRPKEHQSVTWLWACLAWLKKIGELEACLLGQYWIDSASSPRKTLTRFWCLWSPQLASLIHVTVDLLKSVEIRSAFYLLNFSLNLVTVIHIIVIPRLDYCNLLFTGQPLNLIWKLQNPVVHLLTGTSVWVHI